MALSSSLLFPSHPAIAGRKGRKGGSLSLLWERVRERIRERVKNNAKT
jgi:hypothetical protein